MKFDFDIIVVGGGHAGCEAAAASARLGCETLLITSDMNRIAQMSCNPAVGGVAKGQIVREIDALGGQMGIIADETAIQFRMLNRSKGPAVWSPRVQSDRSRYIDAWRRVLDNIVGLSIFQDTVTSLLIEESTRSYEDTEENPSPARKDMITGSDPLSIGKYSVKGVRTALGVEFRAKKVILTAGTFLNGLMHFGPVQIAGGRISEGAVNGLTEQLISLGFEVGRMKTGTPARIDGRSIDINQCEAQSGDDVILPGGEVVRDFHKFSFLPDVKRVLGPRDCYIVHTNPKVHEILHDNLADSPLYNGQIRSVGPRYCPSIETKIVTFADKESHQLFLEPEGEETQEYYINGFSSSLPWQVQMDALESVPALKNVQFYRPGYAIEYDYFPPTQLTHDLQTKIVGGLYFAGQVNGTTGYEEAAAQGLMAGINAVLSIKGREPLVLGRDQAYIGVLIDDLVTKGVDEPYRMFTSRAEYRILLRQDDADMRLTPIGCRIGLATEERKSVMEEKRRERDALIEWCATTTVRMSTELNDMLVSVGSSPLTGGARVIELLRRPKIGFAELCQVIPSVAKRLNDLPEKLAAEIAEAAEILVKYEGYIQRERETAERTLRLENVRIPAGFDYESVKAISTEGRQKLAHIRPATIGQASRVSGVSPADISVLLLMIRK